jgi:hypothetical protein
MRPYIYILFIIINCLGFVSCEKEETPITLPPKPKDAKLLSADMGKDYTTQVYINLSTGVTTSVDNQCWDLAFDASPSGTAIFQNSGKGILTSNTGYKIFKRKRAPQPSEFKWDSPTGMEDSLALRGCTIGNTCTDSVYIINRGKQLEWFQFKIISVNQERYIIEFSDMLHTYTKQVTIPKDPSKKQVYFSFEQGGQFLNFEPALNDWHLCFMKYRWIYYEFNPPLQYIVCGAFINTKFLSVAIDSTTSFYDISKSSTTSYLYKTNRDIIGFDWKTADLGNLSSVKYTIRKHVNYIIKENGNDPNIYKLRFLDFYNAQGVKGNAQFEVQIL